MTGTATTVGVATNRTPQGRRTVSQPQLAQYLIGTAPQPLYLPSSLASHDLAPEQSGRCLRWDGINDYFMVANHVPFNFVTNQSFSWSVWVKPLTAATDAGIICKKDTSYGYQKGYLFGYGWSGTGTFVFAMGDGTNSIYCATPTNITINDKWIHAVATYDGTTGTAKVYLNGVLTATATNAAVAASAVTMDNMLLCFGALYSSGFIYHVCSGKLYDIRCYTHTLTPDQVKAIYDSTKSPGLNPESALFPDTLLGHWRCDDGLSRSLPPSIMRDSSGNNYHAGSGPYISGSGSYEANTFHTGDPTEDIPFAWFNHSGYSYPTQETFAHLTDLYVTKFPAWTAYTTEAKSVALTNQTWDGRTGLHAAKFLAGAVADYNVNRVTHESVQQTIWPVNQYVFSVVDIALSRPLVSGEAVYVYWTGGLAGPYIYMGNPSYSIYGPTPSTKFQTYVSAFHNQPSNTNSYLTVMPYNSGIGSQDLIVYIDNPRIFNSGIPGHSSNLPTAILDDRYMGDLIPPKSTALTVNAYGSALNAPGPLARRAKLKASPCVTFDGTNDYLERTNTVNIRFSTGSWTMSCWNYNPTTSPATFASCGDSGWIWQSDQFWYLGAWRTFGQNVSIQNRWQHHALTFDANTNVLSVHRDGQLLTTISGVTGSYGNFTSVKIGNYGGSYLNGRLCSFKFFNTALNQSDINSLYQGTAITSLPVADYPMSEGSGTRIYDVSGNGQHLYSSGATSGELWANTQDVYHRSVVQGIRTAQGRRKYRSFNGTNQSFSGYCPNLIPGSRKFWLAALVRNTGLSTAYRTVFGQDTDGNGPFRIYWHGGTEAYAFVVINSANAYNIAYSAAGQFHQNNWALVFAYYDQATVFMAVNATAFGGNNFAGPVKERRTPFAVGIGDGTSNFMGDMKFAAMGYQDGPTTNWEAIRTLLYNGGNFKSSYSQLSEADKEMMGLASWWDCNDWGPSLRDRHGSNELAGTNFSTDYPLPAVPALSVTPTRHYGTFSVADPASAFVGPSDAKFSATIGSKIWVAAWIRPSKLTGDQAIASKYLGTTEWILFITGSLGVNMLAVATDATSGGVNFPTPISAANVGEWLFVFGYLDNTSGGPYTVGISVNNAAFTTSPHPTHPARTGSDPLAIGRFYATNNFEGDIGCVVLGKNPVVPFTDIRTLLYNGGVVPNLDQLSTVMKLDIGLTEWVDPGDYVGDETLTGKYASTAFTGSCIPSRTTQGLDNKLPPVSTALDLTGGVVPPWINSVKYLGYHTCTPIAGVGLDYTTYLTGKFTTAVSQYVKFNYLGTGGSRCFMSMNGGGNNSGTFFNASTGKPSIYAGATYNDFGSPSYAVPFAGQDQWYELLFVWSGTTGSIYLNDVLIETKTLPDITTRVAGWTAYYLLSNGSSEAFYGNIARTMVWNRVVSPSTYETIDPILDIRHKGPIIEDFRGRVTPTQLPSGVSAGSTPVPTAYKHGLALPPYLCREYDPGTQSEFELLLKDLDI
jgi:hypothetical protein